MSGALFDEIEKVTWLQAVWDNLVSVLLDSCRVMRGEKSVPEMRIQAVAKHQLDIDGDFCHHSLHAVQALFSHENPAVGYSYKV